MRASAPPKRVMNGGKRWPYDGRGNGSFIRDHGKKGNWRVMGRDGEGGDGGRSENSRMETSALETTGLNTARERKEENNGPLPSASNVRGLLGLGNIGDPKGQEGSLERWISSDIQVSGGRDQSNVLMSLNEVGTLPLGPVFKFGDPNNQSSSITDPAKVLDKASQQIVLGEHSLQPVSAEPNLLSIWKCRARNKGNSGDTKKVGASLGKKKKTIDEGKSSDTQKKNRDAASCYKERLIGLGLIIRDSGGQVRLAVAQNLVAMVSPLVAEALAVRNGIHLACEAGFVPFLLEIDSLQVVNMVQKGLHSDAEVGPIIAEIDGALQLLSNCCISHVPHTWTRTLTRETRWRPQYCYPSYDGVPPPYMMAVDQAKFPAVYESWPHGSNCAYPIKDNEL
ncbi:hypothetical protein LWI29_017729 [Acer saccharum]|uniref:RNase H type-1 domain-containing protein n=1 Tax=Acer saccharum TaxID=4024 RepID=A0AA39VJC2_ACESA|nr:hypothetical protein LWI29_017729 [Acer saccharum]